MIKVPKIIFFDAVGTLFGVRGTVGEIYSQFAQRAGWDVNPQILNQAFIKIFRNTSPLGQNHSSQSLSQWEYKWWCDVTRRSFEEAGFYVDAAEFNSFFEPLFVHFATAKPWQVYPDVSKLLASLKAMGLTLGIISNFDSRLYAVLKALELEEWFTSITLSTEVGVSKPEGFIFEAALAKHQCRAEDAWHVGDSWTEDYQGASAAGLQGVWLNHEQTELPQGANPVDPVVEIADLSMLHLILNP
ncbi:MAG TPA: HAD-IA family hydrolase [Stenomitos sp.]